jgi:hypothetical protein
MNHIWCDLALGFCFSCTVFCAYMIGWQRGFKGLHPFKHESRKSS